jgi:NitT/TauT family transport system permease protein
MGKIDKMAQQTYPTRESMRRPPAGLADIAVILGVFALIYIVVRVSRGALVPFLPPETLPPPVSLDPINLPYYLARSTIRMFAAMGFSLLFTFAYGYIAAHSRRAERILVPLLDILQSVPVLGFLSITIVGFIALFKGSLLGLEAASVFAVFTSQAWNMTFSFYQSLRSVPHELDEASRMYRLPRWQHFTRLELPAAMIGLVWNMMMSFGGGWFFVAASEAISVLNQNYTLPGIGAYVTQAVEAQDFTALAFAVAGMVIMIIALDQLLWRPLIAWVDKFKMEQSASQEAPQSWLLNLLRVARLPSLISQTLAPINERITNLLSGNLIRINTQRAPRAEAAASPWIDRVYNTIILICIAVLAALGARFVFSEVGLDEALHTVLLGLFTLLRVLFLVVISTLIWVPLGVAIGFNPRLARILQPITQFLASFPANFLFPFITVALIQLHVTLDIGGILLMSLGAQWYILFNVIAGAQSVPTELREMAANMGLRGWKLWRALIIPAIFSTWVTGAITASGGAWNASIVSEVVSWGNTTLTANGLGAYIAQVTASGDWPRIVLSVGMMSLFVVGINRLLWRRLYALGEARFTL